MKLNLLIVEDVQSITDQWKEKLEFYAIEEEKKYDIISTFVSTLGEAQHLLHNTSFDVAVIDIRLDEAGEQTYNGNTILENLSESSLTVCAVYTGEPGTEVIEEYQKELVKVFKKGDGDGIEKILAWLDNKKEMISAIQAMQDSFNKSMARAFTHSIWPRWSYWLENSEQKPTEQALTRHMATHLHASFLNQVSAVHPEEYYFIPPLQERLDTGDIIFYEGSYHILVTPRCDLAREQNKTFQLVQLQCKKDDWEKFQQEKIEGENKKAKKSAEQNIRKIINHGDRSAKLHFIPQFKLASGDKLGPFHAEFNNMHCIKATPEARANLTSSRVATLSNEFVPSLVERLGSFFSRIGTPDYSHPD
ncbi:hypothetical protein J9102_004632 [Vibrio vulnificus]|uniref:hypothetical protein n=1 Tax=Vibrio vulnificus TaxID=672 RepID=UPI000A3697B3|nr:hypothetical protein [Vibrio vulnificus]EHI9274376.1 hypothetical protein [Vibrio vulnificus]EHI9275372.1 hypothetical protein [Vibrio vulnificus]EME0811697.1 hypothetical protein [Vibrio vulnificus]EME0812792.1 hypothetical protein [Vibrio vulnificus]OUD76439.1 hypothetical protein XM73_c20893 [Vibrio vulnificus]